LLALAAVTGKKLNATPPVVRIEINIAVLQGLKVAIQLDLRTSIALTSLRIFANQHIYKDVHNFGEES
jgi:hypothetical protein